MKTAIVTLCVLAVANLLGVVGFVAWLFASDRLNQDRIDRIRTMLSTTVAQDTAAAAAEQKKAEEQTKKAEEEKKLAGLPETAAAMLARQREESEAKEAMILRLRQEIGQLQAQLVKANETVAADRERVTADQKALAAQRDQLRKKRQTEQFKSALAALEAQKPAAARQILQVLIDGGRTNEAVDYLEAMGEEARAKLIGEFAKADGNLAAELLTAIRARGAESAPGGPPAKPPAPAGVPTGG